MGEFLRNLGISESGIDPPALHVLMAAMACVIVNAQLRGRAPNSSAAVLALFYIGAFAVSIAVTVLIFKVETENLRYVLGVIYIGALIAIVRLFGARFLGVGKSQPEA